MNQSIEKSAPAVKPVVQPAAKEILKGPIDPVPSADAITVVPPTAAKGNDEVMSQQPGK